GSAPPRTVPAREMLRACHTPRSVRRLEGPEVRHTPYASDATTLDSNRLHRGGGGADRRGVREERRSAGGLDVHFGGALSAQLRDRELSQPWACARRSRLFRSGARLSEPDR